MRAFVPTSDGFTIDGSGGSARAALPNLPSHGAVVRLRVLFSNGSAHYRFGDNTVTVSSSNGIYQENTDEPAFIGVPNGATHIAVIGSGPVNVTVGHLA
jgi:hypothetical protein